MRKRPEWKVQCEPPMAHATFNLLLILINTQEDFYRATWRNLVEKTNNLRY